MTDWSREMAAKLRKRSEEQALKEAKSLEVQRMRREIGPRLWDAVKRDTRAESIALNTEVGRELITEEKSNSSDEFVLVASLETGTRRMCVHFGVETGRLTWTTGKGAKDTFEIGLDEDGNMLFQSGVIPYSTDSLARRILESLLD